MVLDFYHPWANNAGFYLGREKGFYEEEGIDLDIRSYDPYRGDALQRVYRKEADFAFNYPHRLMKLNEEGAHLVSVAACNSRSFEALIYDDRKDIRGFEDLEGKVIGVPRSPRVLTKLKYMMKRAGRDPGKVTLKEFYPTEPDPLKIQEGLIDCIYGSYWGWEALLAQLAEPYINWKEISELGAPYCHNHVIAVDQRLASESPGLIRGFLKATFMGFREAEAHPDEAAEAMIMVAPTFTLYQFEKIIEKISNTWNIGNWGRHNYSLIASYSRWFAEQGFISEAEGHEADFTDEFLPGLGNDCSGK